MASTRDQWSANPNDILSMYPPDELGNIYDLQPTDMVPKSNGNSIPLPNEDFTNLYSKDYDDVDGFLTQELRDLDIPMIPQVDVDNNDMNFLTSVNYWNNADSVSTPRKSHARGPSGTAIFGFSGHNKTLSISSIQKTIDPAQTTTKCQQQLQHDTMPFLNAENSTVEGHYNTSKQDGTLNTVILKQQEELRLALERQKEMNRQLEEQLRQNQLQQQQLQKALHNQELVTHQISVNSSPTKTPSSRINKQDDRNMIVTSNSASGGYQFPPPSMGRSDRNNSGSTIYGMISPMSGTSVNGSPSRKTQRVRAQMINAQGGLQLVKENSGSPQDSADLSGSYKNSTNNPPISSLQKISKYFPNMDVSTQEADALFHLRPRRRSGGTGPITPQDQILVGPSPSLNIHRNKRGESTVSTPTSSASTIPQFQDDDSDVDTLPVRTKVEGLGIRFKTNDNHKQRQKYTLNKPPLLDLLPPIPGSTDNTPMGKGKLTGPHKNGTPSYPQKHCFQHTPIKNNLTSGNENYPNTQPQNLLQLLQADLKPPRISIQTDEEPESKFVQAQTPSPILKSQERFEGSKHLLSNSDHGHVHINGSPIKITRKPTTLPPGEIDRYVRELPDKTFQCMYPDCNKTFRRRYNIRSHIQTHLEDRPYVCDYEGCTKAFVRNHDLIRHKKTHADKCFICPCGKKFVREDALLVHRSRMICIGGKKFDNIVIKKSPRKRGRPRKDGSTSVNNSPVKESIARDTEGAVTMKMEEQLRRELQENGILKSSNSVVSLGSPLKSYGNHEGATPIMLTGTLDDDM